MRGLKKINIFCKPLQFLRIESYSLVWYNFQRQDHIAWTKLKKYDNSSICSKEHDDLHNEVSVTEDSKETPTKEDTEKKNDNDVQIILNLQKEDSNPIINLLVKVVLQL